MVFSCNANPFVIYYKQLNIPLILSREAGKEPQQIEAQVYPFLGGLA